MNNIVFYDAFIGEEVRTASSLLCYGFRYWDNVKPVCLITR